MINLNYLGKTYNNIRGLSVEDNVLFIEINDKKIEAIILDEDIDIEVTNSGNLTAVEKSIAFIDNINAIKDKYRYSLVFENTPVFDDSYELTIKIKDNDFPF